MIHLHSLLTDDINLIEIYITKPFTKSNVIDIGHQNRYIKYVKDQYKNWKTTSYTMFNKNELTYLYELSTDNQIVYTKIRQSDMIIKKKHIDTYIIAYTHSKMPTHIFPCENEIDYRCVYSLSEIKITNRLSLIIKTENDISCIYIEYRHSPNVEIEKIEENINSIISKIDIRA